MNLAKGGVWGAYTNGGALYDRQRLRQIGLLHGEPAEALEAFDGCHLCSEMNYAFRVGLSLCSAILRLEPGCKVMADCNRGLLHHAGGGRSHARNPAKAPTTHDHIFYGTPFANMSMAEVQHNVRRVRL